MRKITLILRMILVVALVGWSAGANGQTNPTAQSIPYSQDFSALTHASTTYPDGIQGWTIGTAASLNYRTTAPTANANLTASSTAAINTGGVHNYNGKIGFLQTASTDPAICLSIITTGKSNIVVTYDAMTIRNPWDGTTSNNRINELSLQYRIGTSGTFTDVFGVEFRNIGTNQTTAVTTPQNLQTKSITLPSACNNQAEVQIRWVAKDVSGAGSRPSFAIDNISVNEGTFTNYYPKSSGNLNIVSNWGTNTDGSGPNPTNFTADYQVFNIQNNTTPTIGAAWVVSGIGSKVVVGDGTNTTIFTIPSSFAVNAVIDVSNNATLKMQNTTLPSLGNFAVGSTIEFGQSAGLTLPDRNYPSNLIISGSGVKTWSPGANRTLSGNLTVQSGTFAYGNGVTLTITGNVHVDAGAVISMGSSANRIVASGSGRTFTLNGDARVTANETQTAGATSPFSYQYNNFATYTFAPASWVSFRSPTTGIVTQGIDGITASPFGNVEILQNQAVNNVWTIKSNLELVGTLAFPRTAAGTMTVNFGSFTTKVGGAIQLSGSTANTQSGSRTYNMGTSTIELNGTAAQTTLGGTDLPGTFNNLTISNSHASGVTTNNAITVNGITTINSGSIYSVGATLTANGAVNVNGTFRLNSGGWATGSGAWTYGENGTLAFNSTYGVNSDHVYWPTTNGPANVSVLTGILTLNSGANKTVSGLFQTAGGVALSSATLTLNGTVQINSGGYFSNAPVYGANSTLKYNTGGVYGRSTEWNSPANVQLSNNTTLNYPNTGGGAFSTNLSIPGNLTVDAGSALYMDYGGGDNKSGRLTVGGNVSLAGNLSLGNAVGGDLYVGGNWTRTAGSFSPNSREVRFNGTSGQSINNASDETFAWLTIANTAGNTVTMNDNVTVSNNLEIGATSALTLVSEKSLSVNGNFTIKSTSAGTGTFISNGTTTISGTTTTEQYLAHTRNWYVSSPLSAAVVPVSGYTVYRRYEPGSNWLSVTNPGQFTPGVGYIALPGSAGSTLSFSGGSLNSANVVVGLTNSGTSATGFNLIGNPYPSHLTWTKAFTDANEALIQPTIWYRTNAGTVNNSGQWAFHTYNAFSGHAVPEGTTGVIPPMQAFWVKAIAPGDLTLNSLLTRSHQSSNPLKAPAATQNTNQQLRIELTNGSASDEILIYFHEQAQNIFDRYDSPKFMDANAPVQLYSNVGNNQLVINGMSSDLVNAGVYLGFKTTTAGNYQLRPFSIQNFDPAVRILLRDNLLNTETEITGGDSYAFSTTETTSDSRFSILFRAPGATTDTPSASLSNLSVYGSNGRIVVEGARLAENNARILLYNQTGQLLKEVQATGNRTEVGSRFAQGVYLVVVEAEGSKTTHKIIMK